MLVWMYGYETEKLKGIFVFYFIFIIIFIVIFIITNNIRARVPKRSNGFY